jgi:uncharacterized protein (TIGR03435 family)
MPPETTKEQFSVMLQNLLAERFKMTVHRETKELPMYSMIVGKNGPKLKESPPEATAAPADVDDTPKPPPPLPGPGQMKFDSQGFPILPLPAGGGRGGIFQMMMPGRSRLIANRQTTQDLAERLSSVLTKPVTDATGLKAKYDFTLTYSPEGLASGGGLFFGAPPPPPPGGGGGRSLENMPDVEPPQDLFSAIQAQLRLKLDPKKGPVELIVVDKAEKTPTEN